MAGKRLRQLLQNQHGSSGVYAETIATYQAAMRELCDQVRLSVQELLDLEIHDVTTIKISETDHLLTEQGLGAYHAPGLALQFDGTPGAVELVPRGALIRAVTLPSGRWAAGMQGQACLQYGAVRVVLARVNNQWKVGLGNELRAVNATSMEEALVLLLEVVG